MIDEAIGKILGMAMAYVASAMGMFVAYVNYRKRIVQADTVMTPVAWVVITVIALSAVAGVIVVGQLASDRSAGDSIPVAEVSEPAPAEPQVPTAKARAKPERRRWTWLGIVVPGAIFLFATLVTTGLHRHFSSHRRSV